jgi:hypothetical protein
MINGNNILDKKAKKLFNKYELAIMKSYRTDFQKQNAMGIATILWMLLVTDTDTDTEEKVYEALDSVIHNHESRISFGSLYYHKMKKNLTNEQINYL